MKQEVDCHQAIVDPLQARYQHVEQVELDGKANSFLVSLGVFTFNPKERVAGR